MTLLNRPSNGHVSSMIVAWRTLRALGPMTRKELLELCGPRGDVPKDAAKRLPGTVATWMSLGMIVAEGELIRLAKPFDQVTPDDVESLRTVTLTCLMRPENCPALLGGEDESDDSDDAKQQKSLASDFVRVASWFLAQDPYEIADWKQQDVLAHTPMLFKGDGRWPSFQEWAHFTGLGLQTEFGFVPTPARAIRQAVADSKSLCRLDATVDTPLPAFLQGLATILPILDGGTYRREVEAKFVYKGNDSPPISASLSLALLQLEHEDQILLQDLPGDVAQRFTLIGRRRKPIRSCTHVRRRVAS